MKYIRKYFTKDLLVIIILLGVMVHYIIDMVYPYLSAMSTLQLTIHCGFVFVTFLVVRLIRTGVMHRDAACGIWLLGMLGTFIGLMVINTPRETNPVYYSGIVVLLYYAADILVANIKDFMEGRASSSDITKTENSSSTEQ